MLQTQAESKTFADLPINRCMDRIPSPGDLLEVEKKVTSFYSRYPKYRGLRIAPLIGELVNGKTIEEIHDKPPFPFPVPD